MIDGSLADITSNKMSECDVDRQAASEALPPILIPIEKIIAAESEKMIFSQWFQKWFHKFKRGNLDLEDEERVSWTPKVEDEELEKLS